MLRQDTKCKIIATKSIVKKFLCSCCQSFSSKEEFDGHICVDEEIPEIQCYFDVEKYEDCHLKLKYL